MSEARQRRGSLGLLLHHRALNSSLLCCRAGARRTGGARQGLAQERGPPRARCHATRSRSTIILRTRSWKSRFPRTGASQVVEAVTWKQRFSSGLLMTGGEGCHVLGMKGAMLVNIPQH